MPLVLEKRATSFKPRDCAYDPLKDVHPVEQFGFINLVDCISEGVVPSDLSIDDSSFNGVEEPASLLGRPSDVFDAIRRAEYVQNGSAKADSSSDSVVEHE